MKYLYTIFFIFFILISLKANATPASEALLNKYKIEGASNFNIERGKKLWHQVVPNRSGEKLSCETCHGTDLNVSGKHRTTNKIIEAMAASSNSERYTDEKKIEKWFKRNCNDTWERECTSQEKGDILKYLLSL